MKNVFVFISILTIYYMAGCNKKPKALSPENKSTESSGLEKTDAPYEVYFIVDDGKDNEKDVSRLLGLIEPEADSSSGLGLAPFKVDVDGLDPGLFLPTRPGGSEDLGADLSGPLGRRANGDQYRDNHFDPRKVGGGRVDPGRFAPTQGGIRGGSEDLGALNFGPKGREAASGQYAVKHYNPAEEAGGTLDPGKFQPGAQRTTTDPLFNRQGQAVTPTTRKPQQFLPPPVPINGSKRIDVTDKTKWLGLLVEFRKKRANRLGADSQLTASTVSVSSMSGRSSTLRSTQGSSLGLTSATGAKTTEVQAEFVQFIRLSEVRRSSSPEQIQKWAKDYIAKVEDVTGVKLRILDVFEESQNGVWYYGVNMGL